MGFATDSENILLRYPKDMPYANAGNIIVTGLYGFSLSVAGYTIPAL